MNYKMIQLTETLTVQRIISIHYFEYMSGFAFPGEFHNFWEFLCVDKGEVEIIHGNETVVLRRGDIIFHKPNEFHAVSANGAAAPNLVVVGFDCPSPSMQFFENQQLTIGGSERNLIARIIMEAKECYSCPLDDPYLEELIRSKKPPFGGEQMIKILLEQLLIQLYRNFSPCHQLKSVLNHLEDSDVLHQDIIAYFEKNIRMTLNMERICRDNLISGSQLKKLFRERHGGGVMEYFTAMKTDLAKQLIRNRKMNFTQIADYLGYASVHYFSRQFKKQTGMSPSEYMASIKQRTERTYD